jgi:hypothetical protein
MNNYTQLCVWPGTVLGEGSVQDFENWFLDAMGVRVQYKCEQVTNPDLDNNGNPVPETGGRNDLFFYIHSEDIQKFAIPRFQMGIRWWEDVVKYNDNSHLYTTSFLEENPTTW